MDTVEALLDAYRKGTPRQRWAALEGLPSLGRDAEVPLVNLLLQTHDNYEARSILHALSKLDLTFDVSVDAVVQRLSAAATRYSAADCLLHCSPKLKRHIPVLRTFLHSESDESTRAVLQKLLDRYPQTA